MLCCAAMGQIICIANQKGGVGKTTTAINLAAALATAGQRTLLVDCDPQGNATTGLGLDKATIEQSLYHTLIGQANIDEIIQSTQIQHLHILPARVELTGFEVEMMAKPHREQILRDLLTPLKANYQFILIDCPPSLSLLTVNAMTAAGAMLIPLQCEFFALEGLGQLLKTMKRIKGALNPSLKITGILLTMFDRRTNLSQQVAQEAETYFRHLVFKTTIPRNVRLAEAPSYGKPIFSYDAASAGARSYLALAKEIMQRSTPKTHS